MDIGSDDTRRFIFVAWTEATLEVRMRGYDMRYLRVFLTIVVALFSINPACADLGEQLGKLLADDGVLDDSFGRSVATNGTIAIVGSRSDGDGVNSGSVYLYDITRLVQIAELTADDASVDASFGASVAICGDIAVIGAHSDSTGGASTGAAYIFDVVSGQQLFKLTAEDGASGDSFGCAVAISGPPDAMVVLVGADGDDDLGSNSGSAYLFDANTGGQMAMLLADDGFSSDRFGNSVGLNVTLEGGLAVIGAFGNNNNGINTGAVYLFDIDSGAQVTKLLANDSQGGEWFGFSVAISGSTVIAGDPKNYESGNEMGAAYLFDTTTQSQIGKLLANDGADGDQFGRSVAIGGPEGEEIVVVGARYENENSAKAGAAYLFRAATGEQIEKLLAEDGTAIDTFGSSVGIGGAPGEEVAIVGSPLDDDNGLDSGSAYLFDAGGAPACPPDIDDDGLVGFLDLLAILGTWGPCLGCDEDLHPDGTVDFIDLVILLGAWGPCPKG